MLRFAARVSGLASGLALTVRAAGLLTGTTLLCQCHGSQFDVTSGAVLRGPAEDTLTTYHVREKDGQIQIGI